MLEIRETPDHRTEIVFFDERENRSRTMVRPIADWTEPNKRGNSMDIEIRILPNGRVHIHAGGKDGSILILPEPITAS